MKGGVWRGSHQEPSLQYATLGKSLNMTVSHLRSLALCLARLALNKCKWWLAVLPGSGWRLRGAAAGNREAICASGRNEGEQGPRCHSGTGVKGQGTFHAGVSYGEDHTCLGPTCACLSFHTPQMRCLTMPTLFRALAQAQAARAGRTKGTFPGCGHPASRHEVTSAWRNPSPCRACQWPGPPQQCSGSHLQ